MASEAGQRWTIVLALLLLGLTLYSILGPSGSPAHARLPPEKRPHDSDDRFHPPPHRLEPVPPREEEDVKELPAPPKHDGWVYAERPETDDLQATYSRCGSLLPPDSMWRTKVRKPGDHHGRLPLVPLAQREDLGCLLELFSFKTGAELGAFIYLPYDCTGVDGEGNARSAKRALFEGHADAVEELPELHPR